MPVLRREFSTNSLTERPTTVKPELISKREGRTETANSNRLICKFGSQLRYVIEWGDWIVWDGHRWKRDVGGILVQEKAVEVARGLWLEIVDCRPKINDPTHPAVISWQHAVKDMYGFARASNSAKGIAAMVTLARSLASINVWQLDTNPWLLNVTNGTLDLSTGKLREHRQTDYITKLCPHAYKPLAPCPTWHRCLNDIFQGKQELIRYLRQILGYSLTGDVREQILPIFWGVGANGKSTVINAVQHVFGEDYSGTPPLELFVVSRVGSRHPTELMTLQGKRLMIASETEAGAQLTEARIKHLTGGDLVTARGMYENFSSFLPTHKLLLSTNHKPEIRGSDEAIWRRPKLIPFLVKFAGESRDKEMGDKLKAEAEGLLAWMVRGCLEWQKNGGLAEPEEVRVATQCYRDEQDAVGRFLREHCEIDAHWAVLAGPLYNDAFLKAFPDSRVSKPAFGRMLGKLGYVKGRVKNGPHKAKWARIGLYYSGAEILEASDVTPEGND